MLTAGLHWSLHNKGHFAIDCVSQYEEVLLPYEVADIPTTIAISNQVVNFPLHIKQPSFRGGDGGRLSSLKVQTGTISTNFSGRLVLQITNLTNKSVQIKTHDVLARIYITHSFYN
jgi:dUTPase